MAYSKYKSATAQTTGTITTEHDALWVGDTTSGAGTDGELKVTMVNDTVAVTFKGITAGTFLPFEVTDINAAGSGVGSIISLESGERWSA
jgi:hypothetical protein